MCHAGEDGDVQGPVQTSIAAAVEAVADGVPRGRRDRTHAGQSGKRGLGTHPAVMGPCGEADGDRKSTRLNSSHVAISYAVFCLKQKIHVVSILSDIVLATV